jgi:hypothetical protein
MALRALATPDFIMILQMSINVISVPQIHFVLEETFHTLRAPKMPRRQSRVPLAQPALAITGTVGLMLMAAAYVSLGNIL